MRDPLRDRTALTIAGGPRLVRRLGRWIGAWWCVLRIASHCDGLYGGALHVHAVTAGLASHEPCHRIHNLVFVHLTADLALRHCPDYAVAGDV